MPNGALSTMTVRPDDDRVALEDLRQAKQRTAEALTLLETMQANAPMGFAFVDREFRYLRVNEILAAINGRSVEEHLGRTVVEVVPDLWPQIGSVYDRVLKTGEPAVNIELSGETSAYPEQVRDWLTSFYPVRLGGEVMGIGVIVLDITERKRAEEFRAVVLDNMLEGLCVVDGDGRLTHMNQSASKMLGWSEGELRGKVMHDVVHYQQADGTPISLDECALQQMRGGAHPARLSGEAFTRSDGSIFPVTYSLAPIRSASGRPGIVVVFRDVTEEATEQAAIRRQLAALSWIGRIRDALDEDRFVLLAQPIVPLGGGERSVELLLRMVGHDGELVMPGSFLPVAEKYGLIGEIDRWVTTEAIRLAGGGLNVAVNLSAHSIRSLDLLSLIEREVGTTGADPSKLVFEITETALIADLEAAEAFARGLAALGCGLALDDFGTGFGSLSVVKRLALNYLKIDIEFVRDLAESPANQHVVRAIVGLAQAFGLQTIAEGVEDEATLNLLCKEGVDFAQGFHVGRPAPLPALDAPERAAAT
jgi:PAS domain S-box-containing protein